MKQTNSFVDSMSLDVCFDKHWSVLICLLVWLIYPNYN